jgi:hypothetical protein
MSELGPVISRLNHMQGLVVHLDNKVGQVGNEVVKVSAVQEQTRSELAQLCQDFLAFRRESQLTANIQRAETRLVALQDQLENEFGHHKVVRRTAVGTLHAFDIGVVSEETVRTVAEELMLQTPRYWLAPALVALAAWSADKRDLSARAVEEAFRRSPAHTSLFLALILRRQERPEAALRWLRHYLSALDPLALGRDFAVILEAIAQGAFGPAANELVQQTQEKWQSLLSADDAVTAAQVIRWRHAIEAHVPAGPLPDYPMLARVSPQWPQLDHGLRAASAHEPLAAMYAAMLDEEPVCSARIEDAVDDIVDRLVSEYDLDELPLRREVAANQAIIDCRGDLDQAKQAATDSAVALENTLDYLTVQTESALNPEGIGVSRATQRLAVAACRPWFRTAHGSFCAEYRKSLPSDVQAHFDSTHTVGARAFQLPPWTGSFTSPLPELEQRLGRHWDDHTRRFVDALRFNWRNYAIIAAVVLFFVLVLIMPAAPGFGLFVTLVAGGIWALVIYNRHSTAQAAVRQAEHVLSRAKAESLAQLRAAAAELTDWQSTFRTADLREGDVQAVIDRFATSGHAPTPFESRTITERSSR